MDNVLENGTRFNGMADLYDEARPRVPLYPVEILTCYLGRTPERVVDLGCGPGISTEVWKGHAKEVIGVEPNGGYDSPRENEGGGWSGDSVRLLGRRQDCRMPARISWSVLRRFTGWNR